MSLSISSVLSVFLVYVVLLAARVVWFVDRVTANIERIFSLVLFCSIELALFSVVRSQLLVYAPYALAYQPSFDTQLTVSPAGVLGAYINRENKPRINNEITFPEVTAKSYLVVDRKTGKILAEKDKDIRLASASTTKLMTALVALDVYSPDDVITVSKDCAELESTKAGLPEGTSYKAYDLITAMLIGSAGDAACVLTEGKIDPDEFIYRMNQKAYSFGMKQSFFTNAIGLDGVDSSHFSAAHDLYLLGTNVMKNLKIAAIVKTKDYTIKSTDDSFIGKLENTNRLLWEIPQTVGIKTGQTIEAKEVLVYEYADAETAKDIIIVVMGSDNRFSDTRALLFWTLASYEF